MHYFKIRRCFFIFLFTISAWQPLLAQENQLSKMMGTAEKEVSRLMKKGNIPGLALVVIKDNVQYIRYYGFADKGTQTPVSSRTLFEIGSCSKAFTALAVMKLIKEGKIDTGAAVTAYLPWLQMSYQNKPARVTIANLLHHTSGIPWRTISNITPLQGSGALEETVRTLQQLKLEYEPGKTFEYATINYNVLALVVQRVANMSFERYLQEQIINPLHLKSTTIGLSAEPAFKAKGYKQGFFKERRYEAPVFEGNNAAGYVISNAEDMAAWLRFQMGTDSSSLSELARLTHQRDETVPLHGMSSYAAGWEVLLNGTGEINHGGFNPSFTAYVAFRSKTRTGIVILANSASNYTAYLGGRIIKLVSGEEMGKEYDPGDGGDTAYSLVSVMLCLFLLCVFIYAIWLIRDVKKGMRVYAGLHWQTIRQLLFCILYIIPFVTGVYIIPQAMAGFNWSNIFVWSPASLPVCLVLLGAAVSLAVVAYAFSLFYPQKNKFRGKAPLLLLLGIMAGLANMITIVLITSSLDSKVEIRYLIFFYVTVSMIYLFGRRYVQISLIRFSRNVTFDLRKKLTEKIFSTSFQRFEKMNKGRVYTAINDDAGMIGDSSNLFITLITNAITATGAFIYLASIAFWATMVTLLLLVLVSAIYYIAGKRTNHYFEEARDTQNRFMTLIGGMVEGFKELSLHRGKKLEYKQEVDETAGVYKQKIVTAGLRFVNVFMIGELLLSILLGVVAFAFPTLFPSVQTHTIRSFIVILLFLIGPVNAILGAVPAVLQVRVAWNRIKQFLEEIPANLNLMQEQQPVGLSVQSIRTNDLCFQYKNEQVLFTVGPVNLEALSGEIIFIVGGNGSGKTTLAKLLTGLYEPDTGAVLVNERVVPPERLGEYFSVVFSPAYYFERIYNINLAGKEKEIQEYLEVLGLENKVSVSNNKFSTISLSGGQRKRLALLLCYLEDAPIYLFDEWAADQDPEYRRFFYRTLLPRMRDKGKIVIAVTHDDHYFDVADKVLKMDQGKMEFFAEGSSCQPVYTGSSV
jgi:putative pyoverdin transport system ATP-binding/permease protein